MIWQKEESLSRDELRELQGKRLANMAKRVYENVPMYKARFDQRGILPGDIKTIDDITKLPFTTKQDLRDYYPYGLFASPMEDVIEIHASSGTTGKQIVVGYTQNDVDLWSDVMARTFSGGGIGKGDIGHIAYGYGLFTGGLGAHYGSQRIGAATIPVSVGNTQRQITILQDFKPTFICGTPSYALHLAETMEEMGVDPKKDLFLKAGFFGAEPWTENMRAEIEGRLNLKAYDIYGLSEIIGPGVSFECEMQNGLHVNEDHFYIEIIDPDTGEHVPDGQAGEVVFTCLTKEAIPFVRYRTKDIGRIDRTPCACGRTTARMSKLSGRTDDMLIIRGINVFPSQVESVLLEIGETAPYYLLVVDRNGSLDTLEVQVELDDRHFSDEIRMLENLQRKIRSAIESTLGLAVQVRLVAPKTIERSEGKSKRILDKRKMD